MTIEYPAISLKPVELTARRHQVEDEASAIAFCYEQGWTDGLPVVPPAPGAVAAHLSAGGVSPDEVLGRLPERNLVVRAEQAAINAVMAGCLPAYMPVVVAAVRALLDPRFGLHGPSASTAGVGFLTIVNGPYARKIGLRAGENLFGPGSRPNATIGRALRLLLLNAGAERFDRSTIGHPGKFTYCIAEQEDAGWEPLHVMRGFRSSDSTVTVVAAEGPNQVNNHIAETAQDLLATFARRMAAPGTFNANEGGKAQMVALFCPEHRKTLQAHGMSKADAQAWLWEHARISLAERKRAGVVPGPVQPGDEAVLTPVTPTAQDLLILTGGGEAGRFSAVMPGWGTPDYCQAVSVLIETGEA